MYMNKIRRYLDPDFGELCVMIIYDVFVVN